jgi:hypothetical protein
MRPKALSSLAALFRILLLSLFCFMSAKADSWTHTDLKGLDPWGDCGIEYADLMAVYGKRTAGGLAFRADVMNLGSGMQDQLLMAVDFEDGGRKNFSAGHPSVQGDLNWDVLIRFSLDGSYSLVDDDFLELPQHILHAEVDSQLDFIWMEISAALFPEPDDAWQMQAVTLNKDGNSLLDKTKVFSSSSTAGRAKLVLTVSNVFTGIGPHAVSWYDGFGIRAWERPGERRGFKYLLDSFENHRIPMVIGDMRLETFPANEYLEINDRIRRLHADGLCEVLSTLTYGHFMCWQPEDVDARAMSMMSELRTRLNLPASEIMFPYESMITAGDIKAIADQGFQAIYGLDQYRYWFGWLDDWSNITAVREDIESLRKIHRINGMDFLFHTNIGNYQGFVADDRWETIDWNTWSEYTMYEGTDEGLHVWWRRILHDMAADPDQEQFFTLGTDLLLTPWLYSDVIEWNIAWIAAHPWIEAVTFSDVLNRGWTVIDHGDLGLEDTELLVQYPLQNDFHYNAYFSQFYDGGVSDGHSSNIPAGESIDAYADYVPYLRDGEKILSGLPMGNDATAGTLIDETLTRLRAAPDNAVTDLAWLAYFLSIAEQTFHAQTDYAGGQETGSDWGGRYLHPAAKLRANTVNQVNKLAAAAGWADSAASGLIEPSPEIRMADYDLDGEDEVILFNDRVWCLFENDGGRLEYAFSWSEEEGPVQQVAPTHQHQLIFDGLGRNFEWGEISALPTWSRAVDGCFVEDFTYPEYELLVQGEQLIMTSPDGSVQKTFTLEDARIHGDYVLSGMDQVNPGFGLTVNLMNTYNPDWSGNYQKIEANDQYGWRCTAGGQVTVDLSHPNTAMFAMDAFTDSPAGEEMQERIDSNDYPNGHWFSFPYHTVSAIGLNEFRMTLVFGENPDTGVHETEGACHDFSIVSVHPNPFNPHATITYLLPEKSPVTLSVYNIQGARVKTLVYKTEEAGFHSVEWNGTDGQGYPVAAGLYVCRLRSRQLQKTVRMILLK